TVRFSTYLPPASFTLSPLAACARACPTVRQGLALVRQSLAVSLPAVDTKRSAAWATPTARSRLTTDVVTDLLAVCMLTSTVGNGPGTSTTTSRPRQALASTEWLLGGGSRTALVGAAGGVYLAGARGDLGGDRAGVRSGLHAPRPAGGRR